MKTICIHCRKGFNVPDEYKGKKAKCPKCKASFIIKDSSKRSSQSVSIARSEQANDNKLKEFFSVKELARMLGVNPMTVYRMVNRGQIVCHQIGRAKRFRRSDIEDFLERCAINK